MGFWTSGERAIPVGTWIELNASRARIVCGADSARRRIERDLHDGVQQRLVFILLKLRAAAANDGAGADELREELLGAGEAVVVALEELREVAKGIHPAVLSRGGLGPALRDLSRSSAVPVQLDISTTGRLPDQVEAAAYYVVSELLTNTAKHAHAALVSVALDERPESLRLSVRDDGVGGADPSRGSGLVGLSDRIEALGGTLAIESPPGAGTAVFVSLPLR